MRREPLIASLILSLCLFPVAIQAETPPPPKPPRVFCMSRPGLEEAKARIARDDARLRESLRHLLLEAADAMDVGPFSVVLKSRVPPSGDKHDYLSLAPYVWPDPSKPDGLPYVGRDGFTNPEWWQDYDRVPLERLTQAAEVLALTYYLTGREHCAHRAAHLLRVWFLDPPTAMRPDVQFAQMVPGQHTGRAHAIDTRFLPRIIDAIGLLAGSRAWTESDQAGMVAWFREFVSNQRRRADDTYRTAGTNIASFYHAQVAAQALFIGDEALAREMIARTRERIRDAVGADGYFIVERNRTRSFSYSCFHLYALFNLASLGGHVGVDLWNFTIEEDRGLRKALDTVAAHTGPYPPPSWPFKETGRTPGDWWDPVHDQLPVVLFHAAREYRQEAYERQALRLFADAAAFDSQLIHLLCGIPLAGQQSLRGWLFRPSRVEADR